MHIAGKWSLYKSGNYWTVILVLLLVLSAVRVYLVLDANRSGNYTLISLYFVLLAMMPFLLLNREGRRQAGFGRPVIRRLFLPFLAGILSAGLVYLLFLYLYDLSSSHPYVYISKSYGGLPVFMTSSDKRIYFLVFAIIGMSLSPIGEEFFYRGLVHDAASGKWNETTATRVDSLAFGLVHLAHFGIVYQSGSWRMLWIPALLWLLLMYGVSVLFNRMKRYSGTIWGAVSCHAGFNLAMTWLIFYRVL